MSNVIDEYTRECPAIEVAHSLNVDDVVAAVTPVLYVVFELDDQGAGRMTTPEDGDPKERLTDRLRRTFDEKLPPEKRADLTEKARTALDKTSAKGAEVMASPQADRAKDYAKDRADRVKGATSKAYDTVTMKDLRAELDTTLRKVVEVMCVHEAEIAELRKEIDALKSSAEK